jgi:hypothetical protein
MLKPSSLVLVAFAALICCVHGDFVRGRILNEVNGNGWRGKGKRFVCVRVLTFACLFILQQTHQLNDMNTEDYTLKTTKGTKKTKSSSKKKTKSSKTKSKGNNNNNEPPMPLEDHPPLTSVSLGNIRPGGILLPYRKTPC